MTGDRITGQAALAAPHISEPCTHAATSPIDTLPDGSRIDECIVCLAQLRTDRVGLRWIVRTAD